MMSGVMPPFRRRGETFVAAGAVSARHRGASCFGNEAGKEQAKPGSGTMSVANCSAKTLSATSATTRLTSDSPIRQRPWNQNRVAETSIQNARRERLSRWEHCWRQGVNQHRLEVYVPRGVHERDSRAHVYSAWSLLRQRREILVWKVMVAEFVSHCGSIQTKFSVKPESCNTCLLVMKHRKDWIKRGKTPNVETSTAP